MKIGIDNYSYHRYFNEIYPGQAKPAELWDLSDFVNHILSLPYFELIEGLSVETCFLPADDKAVVSQLARIPTPLVFQWGHPNGFMDRTEAKVLNDLNRFFDLSLTLNSKLLRIVVASIGYLDKPHQPQIARVKNYLNKILPLAESYSIKIGIENHGDLYLPELHSVISEFDSPYLGIVLDTGNCLRLNEDPRMAISLFNSKVFLIHAKDVAAMPGYASDDPLRYGCVPAGAGVIDFPRIFEDLRSIAYEGMVLIEISRMHPDFDQMGEFEMIGRGLKHLHSVRSGKE